MLCPLPTQKLMWEVNASAKKSWGRKLKCIAKHSREPHLALIMIRLWGRAGRNILTTLRLFSGCFHSLLQMVHGFMYLGLPLSEDCLESSPAETALCWL